MKAIRDYEWEIKVFNNSYGKWFWVAYPKACFIVGEIHGGMGTKRKYQAKHLWECFATINLIKKWKYV